MNQRHSRVFFANGVTCRLEDFFLYEYFSFRRPTSILHTHKTHTLLSHPYTRIHVYTHIRAQAFLSLVARAVHGLHFYLSQKPIFTNFGNTKNNIFHFVKILHHSSQSCVCFSLRMFMMVSHDSAFL